MKRKEAWGGMRARGLKPIQLWVPDVRGDDFIREAERQALLVASSECAGDDQEFIENVSVSWDD